MAAEPTLPSVRPDELKPAPFESAMAVEIATWICGAREAYWLAPRATPPITAQKICDWRQPGRRQIVLAAPDSSAIAAYGEVNRMSRRSNEYWLGHLIVKPRLRGIGVGRRLCEVLLEHAFEQLGASRVSLVVFPENSAAIAAYRAVGMVEEGYEIHHFPAHNRRERLLRMAITRGHFE